MGISANRSAPTSRCSPRKHLLWRAAGFGDLARQKGIEEGNRAAQNQLAFSNTAFQRQMSALQGLSGLFGVDTNLLGRTLGIPSQMLGVRANASRPSGFFSSLGATLSTAPDSRL